MPHEIAYDASHPFLPRLRGIALSYPETAEDDSHGRPTFRVGGARERRVFCVCGTEERLPDGSRVPRPASVAVKIAPEELPAVDADGRFFPPRFWYAHGWRAVALDAERVEGEGAEGEGPAFDELAELVDASYRLLAPRRAIAALDARR